MNSFTVFEFFIILVGMPQSIKYNNKTYETNDASIWMETLRNETEEDILKSKVILSWRQEDSFQKGQNLYPLIDNRLVPDLAFMIGPIEDSDMWTSSEKFDYIFLLRIDKESVQKEMRNMDTIKNIISRKSNDQNRTFTLVDWYDRSLFHNESLKETPDPQLTYKVINCNSMM